MKSVEASSYQSSSQKNLKCKAHQQSMVAHLNKNNLQSSTLPRDAPTKHHLIQIQNQSPQHHSLVPLLPAVVATPIASEPSDTMGIHGILTTGVIVDPSVSVSITGGGGITSTDITDNTDGNGGAVVTTTTTSTAYFPVSHFQCQPASLVTTTIPTAVSASATAPPHSILIQKPINAKYLSNQRLQQQAISSQPHLMHLLTSNDNNHHLPMQYHTATVHGM